MRPTLRRLACALACATLAAPFLAHAQNQTQTQAYPTRPIHVVFPYPSGSPIDAIGRLMSERAAKILGQPLVFENKPGANGIIGTGQAARAAADGYTIHLTTTSAFLLNSFLRKDLPYDPLKNFTPITAVADIPVALMVSTKVPANTPREFIDYLRRNPGKTNYASVGNGSFNHILGEQFKAAAGVDMMHVPYQGAGQIAIELLAGRLDTTILSVGSLLGQWKAGQIKVLAFMSPTRHPLHPDVPAITEALPNFRPFGNWMGFVAPNGTPAPIVAKLAQTFNTVLQQPDIRAKIDEQHWSVIGSTPEAFGAALKNDMAVLRDAFEMAGVKPE
ncbi:Tripartite tricarboxylate transporter family receptor [Pigmentiphaga humi]|uniref:Tripartite tricarboxylate transporter family receptor n=1 Tax=Pigmentiphaga humi TaxID=2478468 RepID=A0A3P4AZI3_9BURK|nr:tripartite tricarboxylate transporter substrate binding protein [Pigmentiphaga humi]VCU69182.1 Tripartite tricarboxylate transporter family receptor [Pigmentiphaga humi]